MNSDPLPTFRGRTNPCPQCHSLLDMAAGVDQDSPSPKPGDFTVCAYCATMLVYAPDMSFERLPQDLFDALPPALRWDLARVVVAVKGMIMAREMNPPPLGKN